MPWWATVLVSVLFSAGGGGLLVYIARPTQATINDLLAQLAALRARVDAQDRKIEDLQRDNSLKGRFNTALTFHADDLRRRLLGTTPPPTDPIPTSCEVIARVRAAVEAEETEAN
jgi:hypothetical protein